MGTIPNGSSTAWPTQLNGIPLSPRTQWLLYAPSWMLFPQWRRLVMKKPIDYSMGAGQLRPELRVR